MRLHRRRFVGLAAAAGTGVGAAAAARPARAATAAPSGGPRARPVRLDMLTSREVEDWAKTNDVIFVPHGPISGHGPYTTLGAHPHGAEGIATLMARKCNGLVYPPVFTSFAGATRTYAGTVPFSYEFHIQILKAVCRSLYAQGFGRILLVAYTNPEDMAGMVAARDLFDIEGEMPVAALVCRKALDAPEVAGLFADYEGRVAEALIDYASLRLLNQERDIAEPTLAASLGIKKGEDQPASIVGALATLRQRGTRGFRYDNEIEHARQGTVGLAYKGQSDLELGLRIMDAMATQLLPAINALKQHRDYLKKHPAKRIEKTPNIK